VQVPSARWRHWMLLTQHDRIEMFKVVSKSLSYHTELRKEKINYKQIQYSSEETV